MTLYLMAGLLLAALPLVCQMVLNGGELDDKRYLSENAVKQMTSKQTGNLPEGY